LKSNSLKPLINQGDIMEEFKVGDIVTRKSYNGDIYFKIISIESSDLGEELYILKGTNMRIIADSRFEDLVRPETEKFNKNLDENSRKVNVRIKKILLERKGSARNINLPYSHGKNMNRGESESIGKSGKVLHIDGDEEYLEACLKGYKSLGVEAVGKYIPEKEQAINIIEQLLEHRPDILILTGHDGFIKEAGSYKKIESYRNSIHFVEAVKKAREYQSSYDSLFIFAGACQSHFEAILDSGANFASSPHRVLIHAMDPVFISERVAFSSIKKFLSPQEILENTISGERGIGGLEARGTFREGTAKSPYA
jgi:spore coat assembly protein